jgi:hypothetical protein
MKNTVNVKNKSQSGPRQKRPKQRVQSRKYIPAAVTNVNKTKFTTQYIDNTTLRVSGFDLIYNIEDSVIDGPFCVIPANPAYWEGTRIAAIANAYSQYRPLSISFEYFPQVSTMSNGNIIAGTLWNNVPGNNTTRQALATSNGGRLFPIYQKATINVKLQSNLQQNLFSFQGFLGNDVSPFTFIAMSQHTNNIKPGYFMVHYVYDFKNPIGEGFEYSTQVVTSDTIKPNDVWDNTTAMLLTETTLASIGTKLLVRVVDDVVQYFLGGSRLGMAANVILKLFKSRSNLNAKDDEEVINDSEANVLTGAYVSLMNTEAGVSVTHQFTLPKRITLDDLVTFKVANSGSDYSQVAGLFCTVTKRSSNRADLEFYMLSKVVETIPDNFYVLKTSTPIGDEYSFYKRTQPPNDTNNVACTSASLVMNDSINFNLTYTLALPAQPVKIKDVYLGTEEQIEAGAARLKVLKPVVNSI